MLALSSVFCLLQLQYISYQGCIVFVKLNLQLVINRPGVDCSRLRVEKKVVGENLIGEGDGAINVVMQIICF